MRPIVLAISVLLAAALAPVARAHAFPDNSSPHVGATIANAPHEVEVWFDGEIEPVFSTLIVKNSAGKQVSLGKGEVSEKNHALLRASMPTRLAPGRYEVYWSVIAHDGHHTEGHFPFTLK